MVAMAGAARSLLALVALLVGGCGGPPSPQPTPLEGARRDDDDGPGALPRAADRREREAARRDLARVSPLDPTTVRWFEVRRSGHERAGRAALFTAHLGAGGPGPRVFLDSVGLSAPGEPSLRLLRGDDAVWLLPGGALGPEVGHAPYRAWTAEPAWDDGPEGKARRGAVEVVDTPLGELRAARVDHARSGDVLVRHSFAPDHGLVRLEVVVRQETRLSLDLVEVCPRGAPPGGYDASTPAALWRSVRLALRQADVDGLTWLMAPALRRRERTSAWERVRDLAPPEGPRAPGEPQHERVRAELGELLELDVRVRGAWAVAGNEAVAPALVRVGAEDGDRRGQVVLRREEGGTWRWEDLRLP